MKFTAVALSTVAVMALGVSAQAADNSTDAPAGGNSTNSTTPGGNTTAPGTNGTNGTTPSGNGTDAPKPSSSSAAFAIAAGSEGVVAAGVFAGLLAALV